MNNMRNMRRDYYAHQKKNYHDMMVQLYFSDPDNAKRQHEISDEESRDIVKQITFVVTQECNLRCTYCYETHKNNNSAMTKETAKKAIDMLFEKEKVESHFGKYNQAIVLDFIGGEPFLEIELIDYITQYFRYKCVELNHPWLVNHIVSLSSNGILYFDEKVQDFIKRNQGKLSLSITIDGCKELHDACRVFPDGRPSYDIVEKAVKHYAKNYLNSSSTKITIAPDNISFLNKAVDNLISLGMDSIYANCVFEAKWTSEHAKLFYNELKVLADKIIDNELYEKMSISLFDSIIGKPMPDTENQNWCGGTGRMSAIDCDGKIYPCQRYLGFSLGDKVPPLVIGDIENGIGKTEEHCKTLSCLNCITRRSQSTDECFNCPISQGCAWCSAYNYQETGSPNKRVTYICIMHKARVLANVYYWNKIWRKLNIEDRFELHVPKEWALEIISEEEYEMLKNLTL